MDLLLICQYFWRVEIELARGTCENIIFALSKVICTKYRIFNFSAIKKSNTWGKSLKSPGNSL